MTTSNPITGDPIRSKPSSEYSKNYDAPSTKHDLPKALRARMARIAP